VVAVVVLMIREVILQLVVMVELVCLLVDEVVEKVVLHMMVLVHPYLKDYLVMEQTSPLVEPDRLTVVEVEPLAVEVED
jgi:hypothetical protein